MALLAAPLLRAQTGWAPLPQDLTQANLWSIAYGGGTLVAVGEEGTILSRSYADGIWRREESGVRLWLVGVGYGTGRFVVVGDRGTILTSDDNGATWTPRASGTTIRLNAAAYGGGRWLVVGEQGVVLTSTDGATWESRPALGTGFLRGLAYGQGRFLIGGAGGALFSTTDATTFTPVAIATTANIEAVAISANRFWVVGSNGLWASATQPGAWTFGPAIASSTFRGLADRNADEALAVAEVGAAVFRNNAWSSDTPAPSFLATAAVRGENEVVAVGFGGGIARASLGGEIVVVNSFGSVEYGSNVRLVAQSVTNQTVAYQWTTAAGVPIPGATTLQLDIPRIAPETSDYRLLYTTANGSGSQGVTVRLHPASQPEVRDPNFVSALPRLPGMVSPQPDGKLLVAGSFSVTPAGGPTYGLARLNADGSLDPAFRAGEGIASTSSISGIRLLADGRSYVYGNFTAIAGQARPGVGRLLANGALDTSFQPELTERPVDIWPAADGGLYVEQGYLYDSLSFPDIIRLTPGGAIDPSFPKLTRHAFAGVDPQGRVLAVQYTPGSSPRLMRYLADGSRDDSYTTTDVQSVQSTTFGEEELASVKITETGLYAASVSWIRGGRSSGFAKFLPNGGRDTTYVAPPRTEFNLNGGGFAYRADGGLWKVERDGANSLNYRAVAYGSDGRRDTTRYAILPDRGDFFIAAVAPDDSLLAITDRQTPSPRLQRIRPLTGRPGQVTNLSVRAFVTNAGDPLIAGFITSGSGSAPTLLRGIGPGLQSFGVTDAMPNPRLALFRDATAVAGNDNWDGGLAPRFASVGAFALTAGSADAALESAVDDGSYTAVVVPSSGSGGTGLVELYQTGDPFAASRRFINVSSRGPVDAAHPLIAGFTIVGEVPVKVLIRAAGPALAAAPFNLPGTLRDPKLTLYRGSTALWDNNDWNAVRIVNRAEQTAAASAAGAFPFPADSRDSSMVVTLAPGSYTAVVASADDASGTALVEVYQLP